jgi:hypothetical protein
MGYNKRMLQNNGIVTLKRREITMKEFIEFRGDPDEEKAELEVAIYAETVGDKEIQLLKSKGFQFSSIDADSLLAEFTGSYNEVWETMEELKELGFAWQSEA